jgi:carboxyl-terminal processing protease
VKKVLPDEDKTGRAGRWFGNSLTINGGIPVIVVLVTVAVVLMTVTLVRRADLVSATNSTEGNITKLTARLLEKSQFTHHPLDEAWAGRFLDRYLEALDGAHMLFFQTDLDEFASYRKELAALTRKVGDTTPAHVIFKRYLERLGQQLHFQTNLLQIASFDFSGGDSFILDRDAAARPRDLKAAEDVWRERVRNDYLQEKLNGESPSEIIKTLTRRYSRLFDMMNKLSAPEVLEVYLDALAHVYDPHSDYFSQEQLDSFSISMNLSLTGVGATLQSRDGYCQIRELVPGGPAARSGQLKPKDRIVAVAQGEEPPVDVVDMPLPQVVELIRGPKGTQVRLTVIPADAPDDSARKIVVLTRDEIHLEDQRAKARVLDFPISPAGTVRLGVVDLPSFYGEFNEKGSRSGASATKDVQILLRKLKELKVEGVILDLRRNGGGSLPEAISLTGLFIRRGPVVQTRDPEGDVDVGKDPDHAVVYDGPLIILTSRFTASASEILAGALQDYGRALIVGDSSTFGKGTVQSVISLLPMMERYRLAHDYKPGALSVTIRKFYRPGGSSTQLEGVKPDIVLPSLTDYPDIGEAALKNPLPWDRIASARFDKLDRVGPYRDGLRAKSAARVAGREDFACLREAFAERLKRQASTRVPLNEAARKAEREKARAEVNGWEDKLSQMQQPAPLEHEITVHQAAEPGLPPPRIAVQPQPGPIPKDEDDSGMETGLSSLADRVVLTEAERILVDYIEMLNRNSAPVAAAR